MVTLVATTGTGSMDLYAQKLSQYLDVPKLYSDVYQRNAELFNVSFFSPRALRALWYDYHFIRTLNKHGGIVHLPNHHLGRYGNFLKIPYIITVHDLIRYFDLKGYGVFIHKPNLRDKLYLSLDYRGITKAVKIIAVSQTTKRDLVNFLHIPEERIAVVYEGVDHKLFKPVKQRIFEFPYILFVGSEHPRKNFTGLLKAFAELKKGGKFPTLKLVKVGKAGGREADFRKQTLTVLKELGITNEVIFTEYVPEEDLPLYYSGAECFVLPPFYEGFGFPPLEAMACGCPVIVSRCASLPEIAGDAAIIVDPYNILEIALAMYQVLSDFDLRKRLISSGLTRAAQFTWQKAAAETMKVYEEVEEMICRRGTLTLLRPVGQTFGCRPAQFTVPSPELYTSNDYNCDDESTADLERSSIPSLAEEFASEKRDRNSETEANQLVTAHHKKKTSEEVR